MEVEGRSQQISEAGKLGGEGKPRDGSMVVEKSFGNVGNAEPCSKVEVKESGERWGKRCNNAEVMF